MSVSGLFELARSLGLVDTIPVRDCNPVPTASVEQHLRFAIVVDFEATCWQTKSLRHSEIIEFPAVLIDLRTETILDEFHSYVRPTESPELSDFCTRLTGIGQSLVDRSEPLAKVLPRFVEWLRGVIAKHRLRLPKTSSADRPGNACLATWSDWDFGVCLRHECDRKRLMTAWPGVFDQWMDLRALYRAWFANGAHNFADALQLIGMRFDGRQHSGIADARNEARLACRMWREGCPLRVTKDLKPFVVFNKPL